MGCCQRVRLKDGSFMIVCSSGKKHKPQQCSYCWEDSVVLCDYPVADGKTCDKPCCRQHARVVGENMDYCQDHAAAKMPKKKPKQLDLFESHSCVPPPASGTASPG